MENLIFKKIERDFKKSQLLDNGYMYRQVKLIKN